MNGQDGHNCEITVPLGTEIKEVDLDWVDDFAPSEASEDIYRLGDERILKLLQYFKFRRGYIPQEDRIRMLKERIPYISKKKHTLLNLDFTVHGQRHLIFRGGHGGYGNPHFRSPLIPGPGIAGRGARVRPIELIFELKTIADAGLVGLPNAGKSTLLKAVSNAHPKIAAYPFTTLNPYVGTIDFPDYWSMTIADMPGILKNAHLDYALGLRFLRHIERNKLFVYVIDLAGPTPWNDLTILQNELEAYKPGLTKRPCIVVANKADVSDVARANLKVLQKQTDLPIVPISAKYQQNITTLTSLMRTTVEQLS